VSLQTILQELNLMKFRWLIAVAVALAGAQVAQAAPVYFEGFEDPGWTAGLPNNWQNFDGSIVRATSGTAGVPSYEGVAHALATGGAGGASGPFTRYGGYSSSFGVGFVTGMAVYLDPTWSNGTGFELSVAASNQAGAHLRDFIWHVGVVNGEFWVNASNNTNFSFDAGKLLQGGQFDVDTAGWYTLENVFYDNGGALAVDFNLYGGGNLLESFTRSNAGDLIASVVGGNRYGWFTFDNVGGGLAIDNVSLNALPEPGSLILIGLGAVSALSLRRRNRNATAA
jgi:hypothetical protein